MSKDLGKSTSYAYYVDAGGTKTPQEYGEMLVNIDTVATRAEDAADSAAESATGALNSKNAAQTAATTATNKATEATTAATTATNKAAEAQADADAAALDASQALSAASTATSKATEATTAAATAVSAKDDAVSANTAAQSAKTAAQTAQTGAETAAASVQASAAQIATNTEDIAQLKSDLDDVSEFELLSHNILNPNYESGYYDVSTGTKKPDSSYVRTVDATELPDGVTQMNFIAKTQFSGTVGVFFYTGEDTSTYIVGSRVGLTNLTISAINIPTGAKYIRISMPSANLFANLSVAPIEITTFDAYKTSNAIKSDALPASVKLLSQMVPTAWELGTISGSNGKNEPATNRVRCCWFISIDDFYAYENDLNLKTILFAYSGENASYFLGRMYEGFTYNYYSKDDVLAKYPATKYVRMIFDTDSTANVENHTNIIGSKSYYEQLTAYRELNPNGYVYCGERIDLNKNRCKFAKLAYSGKGQDCVQKGNYFFACDINGTIAVKDTNTGSLVKTIYLDDYEAIKPHCNSAVWGNKYAESDEFPLLYINAYDADGLPLGTCYVHRIADANGVPNTPTVLIQTITVGFTDGEPWTAGGDVRPYGNFFVDTENGYLWVYTLRDTPEKVMRFFRFALPDISQATITLSTSMIEEQFDVPFWAYMQGNTYQDGKVYVLSGFGTGAQDGMLSVINLLTRKIVSQVNLNNLGLTIEPEFVNVVGDALVLGESIAYKFTF